MDAGTVVIEPGIDAGSMTDDQILALTQRTRVGVVSKLITAGNGGLPGDKEDRDTLFKALDGLDKVALTRKRITADQEQASGVSQAVGLIAALLRQSKTNYNTLEVSDATVLEAPTLGDDVPPPDLVPGETEIHAGQLNYAAFVAGKQAPAS